MSEPFLHPVRLKLEGDLRRSRLTVFFRLLLYLPHYVWLQLWTAAVALAWLPAWLIALATGRLPVALHRFYAAYVRYRTHANAFLYLVGNPFPGFVGAPGSYPVDVEVDGAERQSRWKTGFRILLAIPAVVLASTLVYVVFLAAFFAWFASLATGRMPPGLRDLGAFILRYEAQAYSYGLLLTDRYPHAGPTQP